MRYYTLLINANFDWWKALEKKHSSFDKSNFMKNANTLF